MKDGYLEDSDYAESGAPSGNLDAKGNLKESAYAENGTGSFQNYSGSASSSTKPADPNHAQKLEDLISTSSQLSAASLINSTSSAPAAAPVSDFDQHLQDHQDLLSQLQNGNAAVEQKIKDSGNVLADVSQFGTVMRTPGEIESGTDFLTGKPLVTRDGIQSSATPSPNAFLTKSVLSPLANRRDTRYDSIQARTPALPMIADPISGIAPQNAKVIKPIKPVATPGVSNFGSKPLRYPGSSYGQ